MNDLPAEPLVFVRVTVARSMSSALTTMRPAFAVCTLIVLPLIAIPVPALNVAVPVNWLNVRLSVPRTCAASVPVPVEVVMYP